MKEVAYYEAHHFCVGGSSGYGGDDGFFGPSIPLEELEAENYGEPRAIRASESRA